jgi:phosphopantothenoylcysteine decarboxylase/phosphopantothenate--cysteine ligase
MANLQGKHIILGVTGSIAAYKALILLRLLRQEGAEVTPVLTAAACQFVGPTSFAALAGRPAITSLWEGAGQGDIDHVELGARADLVVVAPASANALAILAHGLCGEALYALCLSSSAKLVVCPAMESGMWAHAATQHNVATLQRRDVHVVPPGNGELASGRAGMGRLAAPQSMVEAVYHALAHAQPDNPWRRQHVLVTAGPTRESFDPARFVSNASTGKMGFALAQAALRRGACVTLVAGPTQVPTPEGFAAGLGASTMVPVETCTQMLAACQQALPRSTLLMMAAAPADFAPAQPQAQKAKKSVQGACLQLQLQATPDILKTLRARTPSRLVLGFAAETDNLLAHAQQKVHDKDLDLLLVNRIGQPGAGFAADTNAGTLVCRQGSHTTLPSMSKAALAEAILDAVEVHLNRRQALPPRPPSEP